MDFKDKVVVITGAAGGMGSILVQTLKKEGANLILIEKELTLFERLTDLVDGEKVSKFECDFTNTDSINDLVEKIKSKYSKIDFLFHVAGIGIYKKIEELSIEEWRLSMAINVDAPFVLTKGLIPLLKNSDRAMVLSFGSGMGKIPTKERVAYCVSKFALRGFSLSLAKEYEGTNLDFVLLTLGSVMTGFGTGGMEERKMLEDQGKKYLEPKEVINKVLRISKLDKRDSEYVLYPPGYEVE